MITKEFSIFGKKGKTVLYTVPNLQFDHVLNQISWDAFRFYTPEGPEEEVNTIGEGPDYDTVIHNYFDVPGDTVTLTRHAELDKSFFILFTVDKPAGETVEILDGAVHETIHIGIEGDIIFAGNIPSDPGRDINVDYKNVIEPEIIIEDDGVPDGE